MDFTEINSDDENILEAEGYDEIMSLGDDSNEDDMNDTEESTLLFPDHSITGFMQHESPVYCIAHHPKYPIIASGGGDDKVYLWNRDNGQLYANGDCTFNFPFTDSVTSIGFDQPEGRFLAAASLSGQVVVWRLSQDQHSISTTVIFNEQVSEEGIAWMKWHPKGPILMSAYENSGDVWMWSFPSGECLSMFPGMIKTQISELENECATTSGLFSNKNVITSTHDGHVRMWDPKTNRLVHQWENIHQGPIHTMSLVDDSLVITGGQDGNIVLFQLPKFKILGKLSLSNGKNNTIECMCNSSSVNGMPPCVITGNLDGDLHIWDLQAQKWRASCHQENAGFVKCDIANNTTIVTGGLDGVVRCWDLRTGGNAVKEFFGHHDAILDLCISPKIEDSSFAITGSDDGASLVFSICNK